MSGAQDDLNIGTPAADWRQEWLGMPEFVQEPSKPFKEIIVRFRTADDLAAFAKLIGQPLTERTKSIWHPALQRGLHQSKAYLDEA